MPAQRDPGGSDGSVAKAAALRHDPALAKTGAAAEPALAATGTAAPALARTDAAADSALAETGAVSEVLPLRSADDPFERGSSIGRYLVIERLGAGAMGVVYSAYDPKLDRRVAIKLLRSSGGNEAATLRFLREAQAMAQLSHPQVVHVHDVGTINNRVFVAMEYVQGVTLTKWLASHSRSRAEILQTFCLAGRGLHAAHLAGLIHRDFKPDNVLIGSDGSVRVSDFGLARRVHTDSDWTESVPPAADQKTPEAPALDAALTHSGTMLGTPRYMSPEQFHGEHTDERTDQFSFCVALYEALYGELPFAGDTIQALDANVTQGRVRPPPPKSQVPPWLRKVLLRGLSPSPADRYPSMEPLLATLSRDPQRARRRQVLAVLGVIVVAGLGYREFHQADTLCSGARSKLTGIWDKERKRAVHSAFLATGLPYAEDTWQRVEKALDGYTDSWAAMHKDACQATYFRGEQSQSLLDLRMECLQRRLHDVDATVALLAQADKSVVERSVPRLGALPLMATCADTAALTAPVRPPEDASTRQGVSTLYEQFARIRTLEKFGKYTEALSQARDAAHSAGQLNYRPAEAEALYLLGDLKEKTGSPKDAEQTLYRAAAAAKAGRHHQLEAQAWTWLTFVVGYDLRQPEQGYRWAELARAAVDATLGNETVKAQLFNTLGIIQSQQNRLDEALANLRAATAIRQRLYGPEHLELIEDLNNTAIVLRKQNKLEEALATHRQALGIKEKALGANHPALAISLRNIALVLRDQGKLDDAVEYLQKALEIRSRALGEEHPKTLEVWTSLAVVRQRQGMLEEARRAYEHVLAVQQKASEPVDLAQTRFALGQLLWNMSTDRPRAIELVQQARIAFAELGESGAAELAKADEWLAKAQAR